MPSTLLRYRWGLGLLAGLSIGAALYACSGLPALLRRPPIVVGMSINEFTDWVDDNSAAPALRDITVHPAADGRNLVTGTLVRPRGPQAVEVLAPIPFVTHSARLFFGGATHNYRDVRDYLATATPKVSYRYAWWEEGQTPALICFGVPVTLLGILLPLTLEVLMLLGVIRRPPAVIKTAPSPAITPEPSEPPTDPGAGAAKLAELESDLEQRMSGLQPGNADLPSPAAESPPNIAPVKLASMPIEAQAAPTQDPKSFDGGEFYPVHRPPRGE